jgi:hypothetical protein
MTPRRFTPLLALGTVLASACAGTTSGTLIDPGQSFLLGGGQQREFSVQGRNTGPVPVEITVQREGTRVPVTTVEPGGSVDAVFRARDMVVFTNRSTSRASLSVKLNRGPDELAMRYEAVAGDSTASRVRR